MLSDQLHEDIRKYDLGCLRSKLGSNHLPFLCCRKINPKGLDHTYLWIILLWASLKMACPSVADFFENLNL